ncbi:hypothetical protein EBBID32_37130 [Sphingobium indicum BiD32]|uniref:Uncharacterized protein n=1 Tax=Sphingobium indicum BiD32 TaxID=1301087 RepID=N1MUP1_9SPHN|nr:hypothetical protein [Sphingobium indicum]CCW19347.1 hypothetical protein EBBID32_37130 [Sphingobium indicum BiD32]
MAARGLQRTGGIMRVRARKGKRLREEGWQRGDGGRIARTEAEAGLRCYASSQ